MSKTIAILTILLAFPAGLSLADDPRGDYPDAPPHTPEEEQKLFHLPPGFEIQLVASEPEIQKPINLNFDAQGRLWVTGSEQYPWPASTDAAGTPIPNFAKAYQDIANAFAGGRKPPEPSIIGKDTIRILSNFDETGHAGKIDVFADGLNIPSGIQPLPRTPEAKGDTVIAYSIPYIWRLEDTTGSGKADKREILYGPFGFLDTHGGSSSYIYWIDGWIYGTHGFRNHSEVKDRNGNVTVFDSGNTYRFKPDGSKIEHYTHGQTNPFGLAFDPLGNLYSADSHSKPVYLLLRGGYYEGIGKKHDGLGFAPRITDDDHGSSAIGGMMYYADTRWPEEYRGNTFNGNVVTRRINRDKLEWNGATPKAIRQPDFLVCDDQWFRPVNIKLGPDGALWIADFYNPIIGHYEVPLTDPHRDHAHGRIWRVVYKGENAETPAKSVLPPDLSHLDAEGLLTQLKSPNLELRRLATNELVDRTGTSAIPVLQQYLASGKSREGAFGQSESAPDALAFAHSLWALQRLGMGKDLSVSCDSFLARNSTVLTAATRIAALQQPSDSEKSPQASQAEFFLTERNPAAPDRAKIAFIEGIIENPSSVGISPLLNILGKVPTTDLELVHSCRIALRDCLLAPQGYETARKVSALDPQARSRIADVSTGAPTAESAEFLLAYLEETKLEPARMGDYVKNVALHIAPERMSAVLKMAKAFPEAPLTKRLDIADALLQSSRIRGINLDTESRDWCKSATIAALSSTDEGVLKRGIEAVRNEKDPAKLTPLAAIVTEKLRASQLRTAALDALANVDPTGSVLAQALADTSSMTVRKRAAELIGQIDTAEARAILNTALATAPSELAIAISGALAHSDSGAEALLATIHAGKASPALLRNSAVSLPFNSRAEALRARSTALTKDLPPENARLDEVIAQRVQAYRNAHPDAGHGIQVFQQNCITCHRIKNNGGNIGPNLDGVGSRGVHRLIEDILDPSRNVDPAFRQTILETNDGRTLAGVGLHEDGKLLVLSDATGKEISVEKEQVKSKTVSLISLMPPNFEQTLSQNDLNDLIAYLMAETSPSQ